MGFAGEEQKVHMSVNSSTENDPCQSRNNTYTLFFTVYPVRRLRTRIAFNCDPEYLRVN